ncbi:MAG: Uma2 family endonuclease [Lewinella sp.]|nr:Uma2 family endonuclease [Lewinella sp.]
MRKGFFTTADEVELLYGEIVELIPIGTHHSQCVMVVADFFRERFGREYTYREDKPISITEIVPEPQPDVVVAKRKDYSLGNPEPKEIYLIAEVANSSLRKDQTIKVVLYAEAGIQEYWIINLAKRRIEVHVDPLPEEGAYGSVNNYGEGSTFMSPFAGEIMVAELLPLAEE